jgi:uncharacterized protein YndB with AHSA1/START domain
MKGKNMKETDSSYVYAIHIKTTPKKLWTAMTDNRFIQKYFFCHTIQSKWKLGADIHFFRPDGTPSDYGKITRFEPPKALAYTFMMPGDKTKRSKPTEVTFEIFPMLGGVKLLLTHRNLKGVDMEKNPLTLRGLNNGWPAILSNLKSVMETGKDILDMSKMNPDGSLKK